jgi:hypothetical protein
MGTKRQVKSVLIVAGLVGYGGVAYARYLSPEPVLQNPKLVKMSAIQGQSLPTYSYALNNPIRYTDPNGLWPFPWQPGKVCVSSSCKPNQTNACRDLPEHSPKQGDPGELKMLPAPGTCSDSDGVYTDTGVLKIPNNCKCTVNCDANGTQDIECVCWPGILGKPTHYPSGTSPPVGWPPNYSTP